MREETQQKVLKGSQRLESGLGRVGSRCVCTGEDVRDVVHRPRAETGGWLAVPRFEMAALKAKPKLHR